MDNLNDPEMQKEEQGVAGDLLDNNAHHHHPFSNVVDKTNGNNNNRSNNIDSDDESNDSDDDDDDIYLVIPQVDSIGHVDASPHLMSRRDNHAAL